jgi:hypothetical protein
MNRKKYRIVIVLIIAGLSLAACGSGSENERSAPHAASGDSQGLNDAMMPTAAGVQIGMVEDRPQMESNRDDPAYEATARPSVQNTSSSTARMIIKNGQLSLLVDDPAEALNQVTVLAAEYGGYVISSSANNSGSPKTAAVTLAVDAVQFEAAMNALRAIGSKVLQDSASGQDVSAEYVDLESRLRGLEATRERILSFLDQAQTAQEALNVNAQLTEIEGQIEQVKGRMNFLEGRAAYSTITVSLYEDVPPVKEKKEKWSPRQTIDDAIDAQGELVEFLVEVALWVIVILGPYLLIAAIMLWFARRWYVRRRRVSRPQAE